MGVLYNDYTNGLAGQWFKLGVLYNVYTNGPAGQWFKPGVLYNIYTNGLAGQWFKPGAYACGRRGLPTKQPVTSTQQSPLCKSSWKRCHINAWRQSIERRHLFHLYQNVTDYCLGLTTLSQSNLLQVDRVRNVMRVILGTTNDTSIEAVRYLLELPFIEARHKMEQVFQNDAESQESTPRCCQRRKGHVWIKQISQSSMRAVSHSSSKKGQALLQDTAVREHRHTICVRW